MVEHEAALKCRTPRVLNSGIVRQSVDNRPSMTSRVSTATQYYALFESFISDSMRNTRHARVDVVVISGAASL